MNTRIALASTAMAAALVLATPAAAVPYLFTLTGDATASFTFDSHPTPDFTGTHYFGLVTYDGVFSGGGGDGDVVLFYDASYDGGFGVYDFDAGGAILATSGPLLYTGTLASPTFKLGTFQLTQYQGPGHYTLTISNPTAAVPEPASWGMLLLGLGMVGGVMRHRARVSRVTYA